MRVWRDGVHLAWGLLLIGRHCVRIVFGKAGVQVFMRNKLEISWKNAFYYGESMHYTVYEVGPLYMDNYRVALCTPAEERGVDSAIHIVIASVSREEGGSVFGRKMHVAASKNSAERFLWCVLPVVLTTARIETEDEIPVYVP